MKTRKRKGDESERESSAAPPSLPAESAASETASQKVNDRISFYIGEDGLPQWDRISPKTIDQLRSILNSSDAVERLGVKRETVKEAHELGFDATEANALLDLLEILKAAGASKIFDVPHEITSRAFKDTELQRSKMVPPITKVLNKWGPSLLKTWKDEIGAAIIFVSVTNAQTQMMRHLDAQRKKSQPQPVREMPNRNVSAGAETKAPEKQPETPVENPVLESLNATA